MSAESTGWLTIENGDLVDPSELIMDTYPDFVLSMLGKLVLAEERRYKRFSGLRIFARMDVSVFRHSETGKYQYFVNEVGRAHSTHLFHNYVDESGIGDHMITNLVKLLHYSASQKLLQSKPPSPPM